MEARNSKADFTTVSSSNSSHSVLFSDLTIPQTVEKLQPTFASFSTIDSAFFPENPVTEIAHPQSIIEHTDALSSTTSIDSFFAQFDKNNRELENAEIPSNEQTGIINNIHDEIFTAEPVLNNGEFKVVWQEELEEEKEQSSQKSIEHSSQDSLSQSSLASAISTDERKVLNTIINNRTFAFTFPVGKKYQPKRFKMEKKSASLPSINLPLVKIELAKSMSCNCVFYERNKKEQLQLKLITKNDALLPYSLPNLEGASPDERNKTNSINSVNNNPSQCWVTFVDSPESNEETTKLKRDDKDILLIGRLN